MKKILFTLMLLLCATAGMAQHYVEVRSATEFKECLLNDSTAQIQLKADIDLGELYKTKADSTFLIDTFRGSIDGADIVDGEAVRHSLSDIRHALFNKISHATIQNVILKDFNYTI